MRSRRNLVLLAFITVLTLFSIFVVWPGWPKRYLPDFIDWPQGQGLHIGGFERKAMRLGLDLKGGSYVLLQADISTLPPGTDVDDAMEGAKTILDRRINAFGVSETEVTREGKDRLAVQLPGITPDQAKELLGKTALLEFRQPKLDENREIVCQTADGATFSAPYSEQTRNNFIADRATNQLICLRPEGQSGNAIWEPATGTDSEGRTQVLTGRFIKPNGAGLDVSGTGPVVLLEFTGEGSLLFEQISGRLVGLPLGIYLDEDLLGAPTVQQQITGGQTAITGLSLDEAKRLKVQLNAGALPVPMHAIQESEVDATLGENTLVRSVQAGMIGVLAVMAFMILYYRLPGVLASLALITYASTVMMIFKVGPVIGPVTITLAGIAGFVLSIGMAVDANILVFERMKEELRAGRNLAAAIEHGFDRAWTSIRDSNVSTLITCGILWWFGDQFGASLVKGFALTLGLGVLISMFSAIVVTRTLLRLMVGTPLARRLELFAPDLSHAMAPMAAGAPAAPDGGQTAAHPGVPRRSRGARSGFMLDFVKRRSFYFALSGIVLLPGIVALLIQPSLKPGIEFSSGATFTAQFERSDVSQDDVRQALSDLGHSEARVQKTSGGAFIVRTAELEGTIGPPVGPPPPGDRDKLEQGLIERFGPMTNSAGDVTNSFQNFSSVSEIVSREIGRNAAIAVGAAAIAILLYITWSFRNVPKSYRYGVAAIIATLHDALFVLGVFSIFGKLFGTEVNTMFITGLLTIIGFSVHDTIVVFDRIRENATHYPNTPFDEVVNASLTETVGRSINTSTTVVITIVALLLLGAGAVDSFLLVLLIGVVSGTYSSIFVASQVLVAWEDGDIARLFRRFFPRRPVPVEA
ncbi:MAG: protein translocase subunit SecD [Chloroflexi bacterium]|nr:protein translocase subunit SecD [Chloroflexota bacterium]